MYKEYKIFDYYYRFDIDTGYFFRDTNLDYCPDGCEIADIEVSTVCKQECKWCYKSNKSKGKNMSMNTFLKVFWNLPNTVCQIAFGIGNVNANPALFDMLAYTSVRSIVPNITISSNDDITDDELRELARLCGGISVSCYDMKKCFDKIIRLQAFGAKQVNIHKILSGETCEDIQFLMKSIRDYNINIHGLVLLWYKPCGEYITYSNPSRFQLYDIINTARDLNIPLGFDSCSAPMIAKFFPPEYQESIEACESTLFSIYIDVNGKAYPCSFAANEFEGIDMSYSYDENDDKFNFKRDVWEHPRIKSFRETLLRCGRNCPIYKLEAK